MLFLIVYFLTLCKCYGFIFTVMGLVVSFLRMLEQRYSVYI